MIHYLCDFTLQFLVLKEVVFSCSYIQVFSRLIAEKIILFPYGGISVILFFFFFAIPFSLFFLIFIIIIF